MDQHMNTLRTKRGLVASGFAIAFALGTGSVWAYTAPDSTPPSITLVDVSKLLESGSPQFLWRRLGDANGNALYSYDADQGDRTYGVFNVVPRTGFERDNQGELVASAGSFGQTNDYLSVGSHTDNFAYYASVNGNRSGLGIQTPVAQIIHDVPVLARS